MSFCYLYHKKFKRRGQQLFSRLLYFGDKNTLFIHLPFGKCIINIVFIIMYILVAN